ncbi:zinc-dependent metalloprotease [Shewanella chilikensis]|uniref:zinc-dependent metalloprotease n=1 Tax=Shewanella chilikensis TaxID=558541 RepID=UPI001F2E77DF|nr:zinc-dependent metalloprotease [Shewanella chilikensis]MCE9853746.1 zinc-dependent metalloprotease [Shewanella chilikensis]
MKKSSLSLAIAASLSLAGCGAGEEPYKELPKDEKQISSDSIEKAGERQYLYIRSVGKAPRYAGSIRGFSQGDPKLVTLHKTENGIQVRQLDRDAIGLGHDSRYQEGINQAPVLTIPGEYIDFRCTEDKWRECINVEQVNTDANLTWQDKRYFVPDFADTKIAELGINDIFMFGECVTETEDPKLVNTGAYKGYEMDLDKGVINFEIEHTYQVSGQCFNKFHGGNLDNLSFTTTEFISIVALDQLASKDYQPIPYSEQEKGTFGFFNSSHSYRDRTDSEGVDGYVRTYLNRFDPAKGELVYYLSNNFYEPKNKPFLDAAIESVTAMNIANSRYHTGLPQIKLEKAGDKRHGDLRYNHITLFDEPLDNGLAGYGPSAANPLTGEIVSARVNQYSSNLKQGAVRYYRQLMLDYNRGKLDAASVETLTGVPYQQAVVKPAASTTLQAVPAALNKPADVMMAAAPTALPLMPDEQQFNALADFDEANRDYWSEHTLMHVDTVFATGGQQRMLPSGVKGHKIDWQNPELWVNGDVGGKLQAFEKLSLDLQDSLSTALAAQAFAGTLTHEMGHNFGLRHNFAGSRDDANTFKQTELEGLNQAFASAGYPELKVNAEFSSQMDYNVNRFATTFEPYDLAALRFGYAREVEAKDGDFVSLKEEDAKRREELKKGILQGETRYGALYNIEQNHELRSYAFCTDEHVSLNSNCNRSDAGKNLDDIAQFYIDRYHDSYETSNLRHNRQSLYEDSSLSYTIARKRQFDEIRQFIEDVSFLEDIFNLPENFFANDCQAKAAAGQDAWYCANQRAMNKAADLFLHLAGENDAVLDVTFRTADGKAVSKQQFNFANLLQQYRFKSADMTMKFAPGEVISRFADSPEALKELIINYGIKEEFRDMLSADVTFAGRLLNGIKAPEGSPNHPYVNERDVLGVWPDKLLAVRALVSRTTPRSTSSRGHKALVDLPQTGKLFKEMLCRMALGNGPDLVSNGKPLFADACNSSPELAKYLPYYSDFASQSIEPLPNYDRTVSRFFGFDTVNGQPKGKSNLLQMVLRQVVLASVDSDYQGEQKARVWREYVGIHQAAPGLDIQAQIPLNGKIYAATAENKLALALIARIKEVEQFVAATAADVLDQTVNGETVRERLNQQLTRDRLALSYLPVLD